MISNFKKINGSISEEIESTDQSVGDPLIFEQSSRRHPSLSRGFAAAIFQIQFMISHVYFTFWNEFGFETTS